MFLIDEHESSYVTSIMCVKVSFLLGSDVTGSSMGYDVVLRLYRTKILLLKMNDYKL
jgi:hypothetical protein